MLFINNFGRVKNFSAAIQLDIEHYNLLRSDLTFIEHHDDGTTTQVTEPPLATYRANLTLTTLRRRLSAVMTDSDLEATWEPFKP